MTERTSRRSPNDSANEMEIEEQQERERKREREKERKRERETERIELSRLVHQRQRSMQATRSCLPKFFLWLYSRIEQNEVTKEKIELKRSSTFIRSLTPALRGRCEARMRKE